MTATTRRRRPLLAGLMLGCVAAALMVAWWLASDVYTCDRSGMFACAGPGILVALVGLPVALVLGVVSLRLAGGRSGAVGILAVVAVTWALVLLAEPLEPPLAAWPVVVGCLGTIYVSLDAHLADR